MIADSVSQHGDLCKDMFKKNYKKNIDIIYPKYNVNYNFLLLYKKKKNQTIKKGLKHGGIATFHVSEG